MNMRIKDLRRYRKTKPGKVMVEFDFKAFFTDKATCIEDLAETCHYSLAGIEAMIKRGTIKPGLLHPMQSVYGDLSGYTKQ